MPDILWKAEPDCEAWPRVPGEPQLISKFFLFVDLTVNTKSLLYVMINSEPSSKR